MKPLYASVGLRPRSLPLRCAAVLYELTTCSNISRNANSCTTACDAPNVTKTSPPSANTLPIDFVIAISLARLLIAPIWLKRLCRCAMSPGSVYSANISGFKWMPSSMILNGSCFDEVFFFSCSKNRCATFLPMDAPDTHQTS